MLPTAGDFPATVVGFPLPASMMAPPAATTASIVPAAIPSGTTHWWRGRSGCASAIAPLRDCWVADVTVGGATCAELPSGRGNSETICPLATADCPAFPAREGMGVCLLVGETAGTGR